MKRDTLNLTLEERHKFESLLAEYANAEMDLMRATGRRHSASHAVQDYVNNRTNQLATEAYHEGIASTLQVPTASVPTGTPTLLPDALRDDELPHPHGPLGIYEPCTEADLAQGISHSGGPWVPVEKCSCVTCCTARALKSIGKPSETCFDPPPMGQYSGN